MTDLPRGTVTFLFTDIEGSTSLWARDRPVMMDAVERHLAPVRATRLVSVHSQTGSIPRAWL
jgi:class 3 adenylate cyclase